MNSWTGQRDEEKRDRKKERVRQNEIERNRERETETQRHRETQGGWRKRDINCQCPYK